MRILFVAPRFPYPLYRADSLTVYKFIRYFSQRHEIDLAALDTTGRAARHREALEPFCRDIRIVRLRRLHSYQNTFRALFGRQPLQNAYFHSPRLMSEVAGLMEKNHYDLLYAYTIRAAQYIEGCSALPRVLAMQISMTLHYRRLRDHTKHWFYKPIYWVEHHRLQPYEPAVASKFSRVMLISKHDADEIRKTAPLTNVFYNPHGVDVEKFSPDATVAKEPNTLIFHGHMATRSNVDAIVHFVQTQWPAIRKAVPDARLYVVGIRPPRAVVALGKADPSVVVTGFVERPVEYLRKVSVSVDPLRVGAGLQNKVLEAMAVGLPVVATPVANEGIGAVAGENIEIARLDRGFTEQVITLLQNPSRCEELGRAARAFILEHWTWEHYLGQLERMFEQVVAEHKQ